MTTHKKILTLEEQRDKCLERWDEVYEQALSGNINQSALLSAMQNLCKADFEILQDEQKLSLKQRHEKRIKQNETRFKR